MCIRDSLKNFYNRPYKKSARVVGDVIGKYHPHGDSAVYDAMVRMAQNFSMRYPIVEGQGNFGSIDGDPPAAMRYTEVRMSKITDEMLGDIEKETVSFSPNYDGSEDIPDVLPTKIPNLLVNGSSGIAVGMATNIPPHNLNEVLNGCINLINNQNSKVSSQNPKLGKSSELAGFTAGLLVIIGNPKAALFYLGILPGFFNLSRLTITDCIAIALVSSLIPFLGNLALAVMIEKSLEILSSAAAVSYTHLTLPTKRIV